MEPMKPMAPMAPMKPMEKPEAWWPNNLGEPSSSGGQNNLQYAFFADKRRLLIKQGETVTAYDAGDHAISGVSQQSGSSSPTFTSQNGTVNVEDLAKV